MSKITITAIIFVVFLNFIQIINGGFSFNLFLASLIIISFISVHSYIYEGGSDDE
jgi:hypothetical protein